VIAFRELAPVLNPAPEDGRLFLRLTFYADESSNKRTFNFGGWLGREDEWTRLESQWSRRLQLERRKHGKLDRFHAAHCNGQKEDYLHWSQTDRTEHTKALLRIIARRGVAAVCAGIDLTAMLEVYPNDRKDPLAAAYDITVKQLMMMIARHVKNKSSYQVAIIHDWANEYNKVINAAWTKRKDDSRWPQVNRDLFISCTPMKWTSRIALQSADLIAYDTFKLLDGTIHSTPRMRKSLQSLIGNGKPVIARYINKPVLLKLRKMGEESYHFEGHRS
jgi:hypothetical protein